MNNKPNTKAIHYVDLNEEIIKVSSNKKIIALTLLSLTVITAVCGNQSSKPTKYDKQYTEYQQKYKKVKSQNDKIRDRISDHKETINRLNNTKKDFQYKIKNHIAD